MSMRHILLSIMVAALAWLAVARVAHAADPQPYDVTLKQTGEAPLDTALHDASSLISLREKAPVGPFALVTRAKEDIGRFATVLQSFGYYKGAVHITIDGQPLDAQGLTDTLADAPDKAVPVAIDFDLGPRFTIGRVSLQGNVPPDVAAKLALDAGQPAMALDILAAQSRLLLALQQDGYALAKVDMPPATLHLAQNQLDVSFEVTTGPQVNIGPITLSGLKNMNEDFVRQHMRLQPGERFSPEAIQQAHDDLSSLGVFSVIRPQPATQVDPAGALPITIDLTERPLHAVDVGAGYSTDLGANVNVGWHDRNLFGEAEQLNLKGQIQGGGSATLGPGYLFNAQFLKPDVLARNQTLEVDLTAVKQNLEAYDQTALLEKLAMNRRISTHWQISYGLSGEQESIEQEGTTNHYNLVGVPLSAQFDDTNNLFDPTHGIRASFTLTPMHSLAGTAPNATFVLMQATGSTYFDVSGNGRSVLALRGLIGQTLGVADQFDLPPDQRFYAGGTGTVRGFRYQSIGPQFADNHPTGGTAVSAGTIEFRQRILDKFGAVAFVDAGQVTASGAPFTQNWRVGAGVGARYYTSIGPIRLDVAVPLNRQPGGDAFELYIGIGQAF
jgi:translocation and assembly module TamA